MFGVGPTELAFFLVIVLLAVGPDRLPTFMRTVGKGVRQVRNASREFKDAIGLDELMREGDPFRAPPVRPPAARPLPRQQSAPPSPVDTAGEDPTSLPAAAASNTPTPASNTPPPGSKTPPPASKTPPPPPPESLGAPKAVETDGSESPGEASSDSKHP
jgi:Sec-independent protein translocase protein TatA